MEPPAGFRYIDAHTHLHPPRLFAAIRRWFDEHYATGASGARASRTRWWPPSARPGVDRFAFFSYAHRPEMSRDLNGWIRDTATRFPDGIPLGTVHAGDEDPGAVVDEACGTWGLAGLKVHVQVQRFYPDDPRMLPVYERLVALDRVLVIHVGTGPHTNEFTGLARFERVLERFPRLRASICHMGAFETRLALQLLDRYPHLHLDTTMAMSRRPCRTPGSTRRWCGTATSSATRTASSSAATSRTCRTPTRLERTGLWARDLPLDVYRRIFYENARPFFRLGA